MQAHKTSVSEGRVVRAGCICVCFVRLRKDSLGPTGKVEGPANNRQKAIVSDGPANDSCEEGRCLHGMVLRVVAELLRDDGIAEKEGEVGENVFARGRNGAGSRELRGTILVGLGCHVFCT